MQIISVLLAGSFKNTGQKTGQEFGKCRTVYRHIETYIAAMPNERSLQSVQLSTIIIIIPQEYFNSNTFT